MKKTTILICVIVLCAKFAFCQSYFTYDQGYYVTTEKDTIKGKFRIKNDTVLEGFKLNNQFIEINAKLLYKAVLKENHYKKAEFYNNHKLLKLAIDGELALLMNGKNGRNSYYFQKEGKAIKVPVKQFKTFLLAYFNKYPQIIRFIESYDDNAIKSNFAFLKAIVLKYNELYGNDKIEIYHSPPTLKYEKGIYSVIGLSNLKYSHNSGDFYNAKFGYTPSIHLGGFYQINRNDKHFIRSDLFFNSMYANARIEPPIIQEIKLRVNSLDLSLVYGYKAKLEPIDIQFNIGISSGTLLYKYGAVNNYDYSGEIFPSRHIIGYSCSVEIDRFSFLKDNLSIYLKHSKRSIGSSENGKYRSKINTISIGAAIVL